ncbi:uncharacterized protein TNCV_1595771 [Trichonephila clavipes]|nr:uncharacterized protein TNCV_1595771 [Trichonephila clavipes]
MALSGSLPQINLGVQGVTQEGHHTPTNKSILTDNEDECCNFSRRYIKLVESFYKNDEGHNVTVNGDRYRAMITNFFIPELHNHDVQELWFQQDGATCHTARETIDLLKDTLGDRLISRFGPVNWPPRSCDLTPLDYFLWVYFACDLAAVSGRRISRQTFYIRLVQCPLLCVHLNASNRKYKIFADLKTSVGDTTRMEHVSFSAESKFSRNSRPVFIRSKRGARFYSSYITKINIFGGKGILVYDDIMLSRHTPLYFFDANAVNSNRYMDAILEACPQYTVGSTSACRTILRSSLLVVFLFAPDPVFRAWVPSRIHCFQQFLTAQSERSTCPATRHVDQPVVFILMIRPLSNSLNCDKCLLARLPGMFRLPKSSYNRRVIATFKNLRISTGLYSTLSVIVAPPQRV